MQSNTSTSESRFEQLWNRYVELGWIGPEDQEEPRYEQLWNRFVELGWVGPDEEPDWHLMTNTGTDNDMDTS